MAKMRQHSAGADPDSVPAAHSGGTLDLRAVVAALRRWLWAIVATVIFIMGGALAYVLLAPPQYTATSRILIDTRGQKVFDADQVSPALDSEVGTIESQVEILRSRRIATQVLQTLGSDDSSSATPAVADEKLFRAFMRKLRIERQGLSYIIDVSFADRDPERAAEVANKIADSYVSDQLAVKIKATRDANEWLQNRVKKSRAELRDAELKVHLYRMERGLVGVEDLQLGSQKELVGLLEQLPEARAKLTEAEKELQKVETWLELVKDPSGEHPELQSTTLGDLLQKKIALEERLAQLLAQGESDEGIAAVRAELAEATSDLEAEAGLLETDARAAVALAQTELKNLEDNITRVKEQHAARDLATIQLAELESDAEAARTLHTSLLKRLRETEAQESLQTPDARIIAYAVPPDIPSSPKKKLTLALALLGSLIVGVGGALIADSYTRGTRFFRSA